MLPWVIVGILYVLGAVNMIIPAHDWDKLRKWRVRYVMLFWWFFTTIAVVEAIFDIDIL